MIYSSFLKVIMTPTCRDQGWHNYVHSLT